MDAHVFVTADGDSFLVDAEPELRTTLKARIERYIIADDVECDEVTAQLSIFHVVGGDSLDLGGDKRVVAINRFGVEGRDVWATDAQHDALFESLTKHVPVCDGEQLETFRIEQGIPRWGHELTPEILPPEANLEARAIDYDKGCYVGQEVISRMKMSGQRAKKLVGLIGDVPLESGMKLFQIGEEAKEIGWITSAARSKRFGREIALGYVKRPFPPNKFKLDARDSSDVSRRSARVEIVDLPFHLEDRGHS